MINIDMELAGPLCAIIAVAAKLMLISAFAIGLAGLKKEFAQRQATKKAVARTE
jgi:hypothetical protein